MRNRPLGARTELDVAPISIGAMRLPKEGDEGVEILRHAIDSGMRYVDTSFKYIGGESEVMVGRAAQDEYRDRIYVSTKFHTGHHKDGEFSADLAYEQIKTQMERMGLDYLDFFQVWGLNSKEDWGKVTRPGGFVDGIKRALDEGLIGHTGFTTHLLPEDLNPMLEQADWCEVVLMGYNFLDPRREESLALCKKLGIGTLVMNPVAGGKLAGESTVLQEIVEKVGAESLPDLAIRYVLANPNVDSSVCGMTRMSDVDDSIASAERGPLTAEQVEMVNEFIGPRSRENAAFCTACEYCMPCPEEIKICRIMGCICDDKYLGLKESAIKEYRAKWTGEKKAESCTACKQCEEKCPQGLKISDEMQYALANYAEKDS